LANSRWLPSPKCQWVAGRYSRRGRAALLRPYDRHPRDRRFPHLADRDRVSHCQTLILMAAARHCHPQGPASGWLLCGSPVRQSGGPSRRRGQRDRSGTAIPRPQASLHPPADHAHPSGSTSAAGGNHRVPAAARSGGRNRHG